MFEMVDKDDWQQWARDRSAGWHDVRVSGLGHPV